MSECFSFAAHSFYKNSLILILINNTIKIGFIYLVAFLYYVNQFFETRRTRND